MDEDLRAAAFACVKALQYQPRTFFESVALFKLQASYDKNSDVIEATARSLEESI